MSTNDNQSGKNKYVEFFKVVTTIITAGLGVFIAGNNAVTSVNNRKLSDKKLVKFDKENPDIKDKSDDMNEEEEDDEGITA